MGMPESTVAVAGHDAYGSASAESAGFADRSRWRGPGGGEHRRAEGAVPVAERDHDAGIGVKSGRRIAVAADRDGEVELSVAGKIAEQHRAGSLTHDQVGAAGERAITVV